MSRDEIAESVVLITGGSRGIGYATAEAALNQGASKVIIVARESQDLLEAEAKLKVIAKDPKRLGVIIADLGSSQGPLDVVKKLFHDKINVDHLINNAGYTKPAPLFEAELSDFKKTMSVNVYAPFLLLQELLRVGNNLSTVVNIASTAGIQGRSGWLTYSASKAALIALSESLRAELAGEGINVVCLSPGRCATDLRKTLAPEEDPNEIMQPEQVAQVIMMYLSGLGRLIDSENIVVRT